MADETICFIEWTAAEIEPEYAEELVNIQVQLVRWKLKFDSLWSNQSKRKNMSEQASAFSEQVLDMSGLYPKPSKILLKDCCPHLHEYSDKLPFSRNLFDFEPNSTSAS